MPHTAHCILPVWVRHMQCFLFGLVKSQFSVILQSSFLKVKGLNDLGRRLFSKCQKLACTNFVGALSGKPDYTPLNEIRCINIAEKKSTKKLPLTNNSSICIFYVAPCSLRYGKVAFKQQMCFRHQPITAMRCGKILMVNSACVLRR